MYTNALSGVQLIVDYKIEQGAWFIWTKSQSTIKCLV
jgi:hypothetical protein